MYIMSENNEQSTFSKLKETSSEYLGLLGELRGDKEDLGGEHEQDLDFMIRISSKEVAEEAFNELIEEVGGMEDIPFDEPIPVLLEAERQFSLIRDSIVEEIKRIQEKEEGSVTGADIDTMLYLINERAGKTGNYTVFGGGKSLIYNTGQKYDWHPYETELVIKANEIAGRENNYDRHLILDTTLIIPNDERIVYTNM